MHRADRQSHSTLPACDLPACDLPVCDLSVCDLPGCDLPGCDLPGCDLPGCDPTWVWPTWVWPIPGCDLPWVWPYLSVTCVWPTWVWPWAWPGWRRQSGSVRASCLSCRRGAGRAAPRGWQPRRPTATPTAWRTLGQQHNWRQFLPLFVGIRAK